MIRFRSLIDRVPLVLLTTFFLTSLIAGAGAQEVEPDSVIVAAGDIACDPDDPKFNGGLGTAHKCRQADTATLVGAPTSSTMPADAVLPLGDIQNDQGTLEDYLAVYDKTWGSDGDPAAPGTRQPRVRDLGDRRGILCLLRSSGGRQPERLLQLRHRCLAHDRVELELPRSRRMHRDQRAG